MRIFLRYAGFLALLLPACQIFSMAEAIPPPPLLNQADPDWNPAGILSWQIQFSGEIDERIAGELIDLDAFETDAELVSRLHTNGSRVICYINAGAWRIGVQIRIDILKSCLERITLAGKANAGWIFGSLQNSRQSCKPALISASRKVLTV